MPDQWLAHAYLRSKPGFDRAAVAALAGVEGIWLGLLDRDALAAVDERYYDDATAAVAAAQHGYTEDAWNDQGLFEWERPVVERFFPPGARVVVTAAGAGREVSALLALGYDAVGYEPHRRLLAAGRARLGDDRLRPAERDVFPPAGPAGAVLVGWASYGLIPGRARRVAFLRAARTCLEPGAPVVVSFFARGAEDPHAARVAAVANRVRRLRRCEPVEVGDVLYPNFVHKFTGEELRDELADGGFRMVLAAAQPYGHAVGLAV